MSMAKLKKGRRSGLTPSSYLLALTSFFADMSTEMLYPVLPVFLTDVLKTPVEIVGLIEGLATGVQYGMQGVSGWLADRIHRPKTIALIGFALNAIGKPVIGLAVSWPLALAGRLIDRFGAGSRSTPRDALIAASVDEEHRGRAFGLEGLGDNGGAFLGPMLAILLLYVFHVDLRSIFYFAFIPGLLAFLMIVFVRVRAGVRVKSDIASVPAPLSGTYFSPVYRKYLLVTALFGIGNSTNAFLILRTKNAGVPLFATILLYAFFNLIAALISFPAGSLSDRIGRKKLLVLCFAIFALVYLGFALSVNVALLAFCFLLYGVYSGVYRAVGKTFVTDIVPQEHRASSIGWYSAVIGITGFIASAVGGWLWTNIAPPATFLYGVIFSVAAIPALLYLVPEIKRER
jgi:MFS family permease